MMIQSKYNRIFFRFIKDNKSFRLQAKKNDKILDEMKHIAYDENYRFRLNPLYYLSNFYYLWVRWLYFILPIYAEDIINITMNWINDDMVLNEYETSYLNDKLKLKLLKNNNIYVMPYLSEDNLPYLFNYVLKSNPMPIIDDKLIYDKIMTVIDKWKKYINKNLLILCL